MKDSRAAAVAIKEIRKLDKKAKPIQQFAQRLSNAPDGLVGLTPFGESMQDVFKKHGLTSLFEDILKLS